MTAEIAILNKSAAVLAADSAMTIATTGPRRGIKKIYPVDKLFRLSYHHPVGVMIYNNAQFMGVPWETLIKMYASSLEEDLLPTLRDCARGLFDFICEPRICTERAQQVNALMIVEDSFSWILHAAHREQDMPFKGVVEDHVSILEKRDIWEPRDPSGLELLRKLKVEIDDSICRSFNADFKITKTVRTLLHRVAMLSIERNRLSSVMSGVVVAGFGEDDLFPSLSVMETDGVVGSLRSSIKEKTITREERRLVYPFAQREVISMFMNGVDPKFFDWLMSSFDDVFPRVSDRERERFRAKAKEWMRDRHSDPTMKVVEHLPKHELAAMADALVSITSLKRRVSPDAESVGGPTDVAALSKGGGFEWMRGKHI